MTLTQCSQQSVVLSHLILQLESIDGPEKVRRHLSNRGGAHVTSVSHSPESVYSHLALQTLLYYYLTIIQDSTYWDLGQQNL